jgi:hypothetical protein
MRPSTLSGFCRALLRALCLFALLAGVLPAANANLISLQGSGNLLPNTAGQQITLLMSGSDFYTDSNMRLKINGGVGPAPRVTHIFGDTGGAIPGGSLAGSIWEGGYAGIGNDAQGTFPGASGLDVLGAFATPVFTPQNTPGTYVVLTVTTVGVTGGQYAFDLTGTDLFNGLTNDFDPIPVPLELATIVLQVVPEPSTYALAAIGAAAIVAFRRRKARA